MFPGSRPFLRKGLMLPRISNLPSYGSKRSSHSQRGPRSNAQQVNGNPIASTATGSSWFANPFVVPAAAASIAALLGSGVAYSITKYQLKKSQEQALDTLSHTTASSERQYGNLSEHGWAKHIAEEPGAVRVLTAEQLLAQEHPFLEDDHMFSAFVARGIIRDMEGWYLGQSKKFSAIVALGRDVAGFPRVVHGGLTAAIFDEAFGGLLFSLKKAGGVTFFGPAYTVQLEVSYKAKIPAGQIILCTAEVESMAGRKLWMKAVMMDGPDGKVYATARALFVAPKFTRLVTDVAKYIGQRMGEIVTGSGGGSGTS